LTKFLYFDFKDCPTWVHEWIHNQPWHQFLSDGIIDPGNLEQDANRRIIGIARRLGITAFVLTRKNKLIIKIPNTAETTQFILTHVSVDR
jgi:hypothetical protein